MAIKETPPPVGDDLDGGPSEQELLDAVIRNSELAQQAGVAPPLPDEEEIVEDPVDSDDQDLESDEIDTEDDVEYEEDDEGNLVEDDTSTQDTEVFTADDLDLDALVAVKIDGEETNVSFGDLLKGYTTEQSLTKKGRELGEERKKLESDRIERLGQLDQVAQAGAQVLLQPEQAAQKEYHELEAQIKKARADGDTYELGELKDKREQAQANYWQARKTREGLLQQVEKQKMEAAEVEWKSQVDHFSAVIPDLIPDFDENVASSIREFAIEEGIDPAVLDTITDPNIVKFVDDYRRLKQGVSKGKAKRKAIAVKKVPARKAKPANQKKQEKANNLRSKVLAGQGSERDEHDFLRNFANQSLSKLG